MAVPLLRTDFAAPEVRGRIGLAASIGLLASQAAAFWLSITEFPAISAFCTGGAVDTPALAFGWLHLAQISVFMLGLAALFVRRLRVSYILLASLGLMTLPVQAQLVHAGHLACDMP